MSPARIARVRAGVLRRAEALPESRRRLALRTVAGAVLLGLLVAAGLGWSIHRDSVARQETQAAVDAARTNTEQLLSVNVVSLDADLARAQTLVTEPFATLFKHTATEVIAPATRDRQLLTRTEVPHAAVISAEPDRAEVLVYLNQSTSSAIQPGPPEITTSQVRETLTRVGERWLISDFQPF